MGFHIASEDDIKQGRVTDVYFRRVIDALSKRGINPQVSMEIRASELPSNWPWSVFAGLEEVLELINGLPVSLRALDEGTLFKAEEPVLSVTGNYLDFGIYETAILGLICQASGIATNAARCKLAAGERAVISFGARRMHPALAPMIERNAFIGGCDGVAVVESATLLNEDPSGTMSHTLVLCAQDERVAFEALDDSMEPSVKRIALVDTFQDEKFGALYAAQVLGEKLYAVRLDTPSSRRGDFIKIMEEVRWELDIRGYEHVKIFISGGIDEYKILRFNCVADAYGVGTHISNSPVINFSMDIVEIDGKPTSKRGKKSGLKQLWRCPSCNTRLETLAHKDLITCSTCGEAMDGLIKDYYTDVRKPLPKIAPRTIRNRVLEELSSVEL